MKKYLARGVIILLTLSVLTATVPFKASSKDITNPMIDYCETEVIIDETIIPTEETFVEAYEPVTVDLDYFAPETSDQCLEMIEECENAILFLRQHPETESEIDRIKSIQAMYQNDYYTLLAIEEEEAVWAAKLEEYPEATKIWRIMKDEFGWSDIVCAGIMGNMMAEVAGGTIEYLSRWDMDEPGGLGLIQWIGQRRIDIRAKYGNMPTIEQQLYFMRDEMFGPDGVRKQVTDSQLNAIMNGETPEEVAYNFARYFERCASYSYNCRKGYARIAYNYFAE